MGFLEDKQKIAAYDAIKNSVDAKNAQVAREVEAMNAAQLANQGLAMSAKVINPSGLTNVPSGVPGYTIPVNEPTSITGQDPRFNSIALREALAKQSNGGLANTMAQNSYQGMR